MTTVRTILTVSILELEPEPGATIRTLAVLGDSIGVGLGDPLIGGGWRGFGPLLAEALGARLVNVSVNGARAAGVRDDQLPRALPARPDAAVVVVGMNDTLRSDFDAARLCSDLDDVVSTLIASGALVATARYHDHGRIFRLPGPLARALAQRIGELNDAVDRVVARHGIGVVDLHTLPGAYERAVWSVDRLHPSELGHRMLAREFARRFADAGATVPNEVSLECAGGAHHGVLAHIAWLVVKGIPFLWRRGHDLVPYAVRIMLRGGPAEKAGPPVGPDVAIVQDVADVAAIRARRRGVGQRTS